jgi:hypothetical protein
MTSNASGRLHRFALKQHATRCVCSRAVFRKLGAWTVATAGIVIASLFGLLMSLLSEFSLGEALPLGPSLWLVTAICAMALATAHAATNSRVSRLGQWKAGADWSAAGSSLVEPVNFISDQCKLADNHTSHQLNTLLVCNSLRVRRRFKNNPHNNFTVSDHGRIRMSLRSVIATSSAVLWVDVLLRPTSIRGPPQVSDQSPRLFDPTPGRPARDFHAAPPSSEFHLNPTVHNKERIT